MCIPLKPSDDLNSPTRSPQPAIHTAREVLAGLVLAGIKHLLLSPGSRSAPLAYAAAEAEAVGLLTLHVRIDERSAGFYALGLAQSTGTPVGIVVTSGTAVGELLPAVMEADHSGTPLLVLSADRPEELQGTGASQTTLQDPLFANHTRASLSVPAGENPRQAVTTALQALAGNRQHSAGPVQLNLQFREPLTPESGSRLAAQEWVSQLQPGHWDHAHTPEPSWVDEPATQHRTVVIAGHQAGTQAQAFAEHLGLPLLAEPSSNARFSEHALAHYRLLLAVAEEHIEKVVLFGRPTLSRPVGRVLANPKISTAIWQPQPVSWYVPGRRREQVIGEAVQLQQFAGRAPAGWLLAWQELDAQARSVAEAAQRTQGTLTGYQVARALWEQRTGPLFIGSSNIVRDFDLAAVPATTAGPRVYANRGLAGIDGSISTALGIARGSGQATRAILGDITFLHDASALLLAPDEPTPTLDVVIFNDAGGAIFSTLEHGQVHESGAYGRSVERLFATPHQAQIKALARAYGWSYAAPQDYAELQQVLADQRPGQVRLIEVRADREQRRAQGLALEQRVASLPWTGH